jgi:predicted ABC-type ATPase
VSRLDLIAGPNGAGKSTLFERVIHPARPDLPFVNADEIARQRQSGGRDAAEDAYAAAQAAAATRAKLIKDGVDFCTETVFSHESKMQLVADAVDAGYDVVLHVVMIPLVLSGPRVQQRVAGGGHDVPDAKLEPRYRRLWPLVAAAVPHCHRTVVYDNATDDGPYEVASLRYGVHDYPPRWPTWTPAAISAL